MGIWKYKQLYLVQAVDTMGEKAGGRRDHVSIFLVCTFCFDENLRSEVLCGIY